MCHYVVQELEPGKTCRVLRRLPQPCEKLFIFAFPTAKCHSISGRERLLLSVAVAHAFLIDLTLLHENIKLSKKI